MYKSAPLSVATVMLWSVEFLAKFRLVILRYVKALLQLMSAMSKRAFGAILTIAFLPVAAHLRLAHRLKLFTLAGVWQHSKFRGRVHPIIESVVLLNVVKGPVAILKEELLLFAMSKLN